MVHSLGVGFSEGGFRWARGAKGQTLGGGGLQGSKGANVGGGGLNGIFLQFELRLTIGLGRTLALQSFRNTHLINTEILAKFWTTRKKKEVEKKFILMWFPTYDKIQYIGFKMNYKAFCFGEKKGF